MIDNKVWNLLKIVILMGGLRVTSDNTTYTLRVDALVLRDIAPFGRNVVYAANVRRNDNFKGG